ncbi:MAG: polyphosphate:AMP phosphotransferase [Gammaproteobacteria bacterium]|nr:polyphosphate:AMP phosphotransferase [Gammaproteobacteria bacterium]
MFATAKIGRSLNKEAYKAEVEELRTELLEAQIALQERGIPVYVIIAGIEAAGKGEVVNRLDEWLDARGVNVYAFWDETDEERSRPRAWRFWRAMPGRGQIGIFFGGWYQKPIEEYFRGDWDEADIDQCMRGIRELERMLIGDGAVIVKCWYHFDEDVQRRRLKSLARSDRSRWKMLPKKSKFSEQYKRFEMVADRVLRATDIGRAPWHIVEATDHRYRDLTTGRILLREMQDALVQQPHDDRRLDDSPSGSNGDMLPRAPEARITLLDRVDLTQTIERDDYRKRLKALQNELNELAWRAYAKNISTVLVFEGVDAAGKGGAIRRVTQAVDSRLREVIPIAAPTDEEKAHHYLWRFWRHIPRAGRMTVFDRSWYGRVLVERVEGFTSHANWSRAYLEINDFEEQLTRSGVIVQKFWLQISKDEQLARFKAREDTPYKRYKITDEDWRNREKWDDYRGAVNEMLARTSALNAPWNLIAGNDKRFARIQVLEVVTDAMRRALKENDKE